MERPTTPWPTEREARDTRAVLVVAMTVIFFLVLGGYTVTVAVRTLREWWRRKYDPEYSAALAAAAAGLSSTPFGPLVHTPVHSFGPLVRTPVHSFGPLVHITRPRIGCEEVQAELI